MYFKMKKLWPNRGRMPYTHTHAQVHVYDRVFALGYLTWRAREEFHK